MKFKASCKFLLILGILAVTVAMCALVARRVMCSINQTPVKEEIYLTMSTGKTSQNRGGALGTVTDAKKCVKLHIF